MGLIQAPLTQGPSVPWLEVHQILNCYIPHHGVYADNNVMQKPFKRNLYNKKQFWSIFMQFSTPTVVTLSSLCRQYGDNTTVFKVTVFSLYLQNLQVYCSEIFIHVFVSVSENACSFL